MFDPPYSRYGPMRNAGDRSAGQVRAPFSFVSRCMDPCFRALMIYVGGQNGVGAEGKVVRPTVGEQARQALRNLAAVLESEGGEPGEHRALVHRRGGRSRAGRGFRRLPAGMEAARPAVGHHGPRRRRPRPRVPRRDRRYCIVVGVLMAAWWGNDLRLGAWNRATGRTASWRCTWRQSSSPQGC